MSNDTFVQERAYIHAYKPGEEEFIIECGDPDFWELEDEKDRGVVIIDILGE